MRQFIHNTLTEMLEVTFKKIDTLEKPKGPIYPTKRREKQLKRYQMV